MAKRYEETRTRLGNAIVPNDYKFRGSLAVALFVPCLDLPSYLRACRCYCFIFFSVIVAAVCFVQHEGILPSTEANVRADNFFPPFFRDTLIRSLTNSLL